MRARVAVLLACVGLFSACASAVAGAGVQDPRPLATPFALQEGKSAVVGPARVTVTFEKVLSDSRCPVDVQCIQAGEASIRVQVQAAGGEKAALTLSTHGDRDTAAAGPVTVTLTELLPVPRVTSSKREPYRATLIVTSN